MILLLSTGFVAVISAICPVVNLELFVAGVGALDRTVNVWAVATAAALGQSVGKLFWYQIGASSVQWSFVERKMQSPRWRRCHAAMQSRIERRPYTGILLVFVSSTFGLPPLAIMAVLCGQLHFSRLTFVATTFVGRTLRFAAVLGGMAWITMGR